MKTIKIAGVNVTRSEKEWAKALSPKFIKIYGPEKQASPKPQK